MNSFFSIKPHSHLSTNSVWQGEWALMSMQSVCSKCGLLRPKEYYSKLAETARVCLIRARAQMFTHLKRKRVYKNELYTIKKKNYILGRENNIISLLYLAFWIPEMRFNLKFRMAPNKVINNWIQNKKSYNKVIRSW